MVTPTPSAHPLIGRPPVGPTISLKLPTATLAQIDLRASAQGLSRSQWLRGAVEAQLATAQATLSSLQGQGKLTRRECASLKESVDDNLAILLVGPPQETDALAEALHELGGGRWVKIGGPSDVDQFLRYSTRLATLDASSCREGVDLLTTYGIQSEIWADQKAAARAIFKKVDRVISLTRPGGNQPGMISYSTPLELTDDSHLRLVSAPDSSLPTTTLVGLLAGDITALAAAVRDGKSLLIVGDDLHRARVIDALIRELPWADHVIVARDDVTADTIHDLFRYSIDHIVIPNLPADPVLARPLAAAHASGVRLIVGVQSEPLLPATTEVDSAPSPLTAVFDLTVTLRSDDAHLYADLVG